ncbi:MAG: hypothetical protein JWR26_3193 [Pedosphaera sp.]|nr:hypothetical protein [Pedosphaera sp.]
MKKLLFCKVSRTRGRFGEKHLLFCKAPVPHAGLPGDGRRPRDSGVPPLSPHNPPCPNNGGNVQNAKHHPTTWLLPSSC